MLFKFREDRKKKTTIYLQILLVTILGSVLSWFAFKLTEGHIVPYLIGANIGLVSIRISNKI